MGNLGKIIVATGFEKLPKVQYIAQSGHTGSNTNLDCWRQIYQTSSQGGY